VQISYGQKSQQSEHPAILIIMGIGREVHSLIYDISGNSINQAMIQSLQTQIDRYRYLSTSRDSSRSQTAVTEHQEILLAVLNKDTVSARQLMLKHINNSRDNALSSLRSLKGGISREK
jgi:DNA-binding GntR family transcriptional regulator